MKTVAEDLGGSLAERPPLEPFPLGALLLDNPDMSPTSHLETQQKSIQCTHVQSVQCPWSERMSEVDCQFQVVRVHPKNIKKSRANMRQDGSKMHMVELPVM